jgi:integrase
MAKGKSGRRANGEGTNISFNQARDRWEAKITIDGKRYSITGHTRKDVRLRMTAMARDRDRGMPTPEANITVAKWLDDWLQARRGIRDSSWIRNEQLVRIHLRPGLGKHRLAKLTPAHVQRFYADKLAEGTLSSSTVKRMHETLHKCLQDALHMGLVVRNAADVPNKLQNAKAPKQTYTTRQAGQLLRSLAGDRMEALIVLVLNTGMREGELIALKWADVDLACATVRVQQGRTKKIRGFADETTKTESSRRSIALTPEAVEALRAHRTRQKTERLAMGSLWPKNDLVFVSSAGTHLNPSNLRKWWMRQTEIAQLPHIRFHDLRHTAATWLIAQGVPVNIVQRMLGHADPATTMRFYAHVMEGGGEQAMRAMSRMMKEAVEEAESNQASRTVGEE